MGRKGKLVVLSGFSGAGKGSVTRTLLANSDDHVLSVSMTTRLPREGEEHGTHYFFVSNEEFEAEISRGGLLEYAGYVDHYYGTPRAFVEEQIFLGNNVLLEIEVQGALQIKKKFPESILIFLVTPSAAELEQRLELRGTESEEEITKRLKQAVQEAAYIPEYDYMPVNDRLEDCVTLVENLIRIEPDIYRPDPVFIENFVRDLEQIIAERETRFTNSDEM